MNAFRIVDAGTPPPRFPARVFAPVPAAAPEHPTCYLGEWSCLHTNCPVRTVTLRVKFYYHLHLPRLRCPLCLRTLEFHQWLTTAPARGAAASPPAP